MRIISGKYKARRFSLPKNLRARPTTDFGRENLFNILHNMMDFEGIRALDLFGGTGAISLELASRGAEKVVCVELDKFHIAHIRKVIAQLNDEAITPITGDVFKFLESTSQKFDLIFADPPYDMKTLSTIPSLVLSKKILKEDGIFVFEHSKNNDFSHIPEFTEKRVYGSVNFSFFKATGSTI